MKFEFIKKKETDDFSDLRNHIRERREERRAQREELEARWYKSIERKKTKSKRKKWALGAVTSIVLFLTFGVRWIGGIYEDNMMNGWALHNDCTGPISFLDYWGHGMIVTLVWLTGIGLVTIVGFLLFMLYNTILDE